MRLSRKHSTSPSYTTPRPCGGWLSCRSTAQTSRTRPMNSASRESAWPSFPLRPRCFTRPPRYGWYVPVCAVPSSGIADENTACGAASGAAVCLPGHPQAFPDDAERAYALPPTPAPARAAVQAAGVHIVRKTFSIIVFLIVTASLDGLNRLLLPTSPTCRHGQRATASVSARTPCCSTGSMYHSSGRIEKPSKPLQKRSRRHWMAGLSRTKKRGRW